MLWSIQENCSNYNVLNGHKSAVLEVKWKSPDSIVSCSADKTVAVWDTNKGIRVRKFTGHTSIVNSIAIAKDDTNIVASASDDCTVIVWDIRSKLPVCSVYHEYQVCSVELSHDGSQVFSGGVDNIVRYNTYFQNYIHKINLF